MSTDTKVEPADAAQPEKPAEPPANGEAVRAAENPAHVPPAGPSP